MALANMNLLDRRLARLPLGSSVNFSSLATVSLALIGIALLSGCASTASTTPRRTVAKQFANATVSAMTVQNCPNVFQIKPELRDEFDATLRLFYKEGAAKKFSPSGETEEQCLKQAQEYLGGPQTLRFLELTPSAKQRLQ